MTVISIMMHVGLVIPDAATAQRLIILLTCLIALSSHLALVSSHVNIKGVLTILDLQIYYAGGLLLVAARQTRSLV